MFDFNNLEPTVFFMPVTHYFETMRIVQVGYHNFSLIMPTYSFWRSQEFYTLHFVLEGEGVLHFDGKTYTVKENTFFFLPPGKQFLYYPKSSDPWKYIWFGVSGDMEKYFAQHKFTAQTPVYPSHFPDSFKTIAFNFFSTHIPVNTTENELFSFFFQFMDYVAHERVKKDNQTTNASYVEQAKNLILLHYGNAEFTIEDISRMLHLSHSRLCVIFKNLTQITLQEFLCNTRNTNAAHLLTHTDKSVTEIAELCGYKNPLYFSTAFKRQFSLPPSEYRLLHRPDRKNDAVMIPE